MNATKAYRAVYPSIKSGTSLLLVERQRYSDWDIGERQAGERSSVRVKESK
jgi:hypothetical protein